MKDQSSRMHPTIVNTSSNFVVVTYWWGSGNKNKNTQRPCPDEMEEGDTIHMKPITYDAMIKRWKHHCRKSRCNFMAVEYPEFAKKGGYQQAINYKPAFIYNALKACYPRNVLYIDGDMLIRKYPHICDRTGIDYMAQGWNAEVRNTYTNGEDPCFYPYVFEVSGGTMFFSQSVLSKQLLEEWYRKVLQYPKKAEDRLISALINRQRDYLHLSTIQLPWEFLWLSLDYNDYFKRDIIDKKKAVITHPECLTSEDTAAIRSGEVNMNRFPPRYSRDQWEHIQCHMRNIPFYEYIFFTKKREMIGFKGYLKAMKQRKIFKIIPYDKKYGTYNKIASENTRVGGIVKRTLPDKSEIVLTHTDTSDVCIRTYGLIPIIIACLEKGKSVYYLPKGARRNHHVQKHPEFDWICKNTNTSKKRYKKEYFLKVDKQKAMYFNPGNSVLVHLLKMSTSIADMERHFNASFLFISLIRCHWL